MQIRWNKIRWWHVALAAGGLVWLFDDQVGEAVDVVSNLIGDLTNRGRRLTTSPARNDAGRVTDTPEKLLAEAQALLGRAISMDAYALARMVRSEGGNGPVPEKQARVWVALNDRDAHRWSTLYTIAGPTGLFGPQRGWRYASGSDPYENDLYLAEAVLAGQLADNTGGATKFVDIDSFGVQEGTGSYEDLVERWGKDGLAPFEVEGARAPFRVFRRVA